jgi:hypothetical protein
MQEGRQNSRKEQERYSPGSGKECSRRRIGLDAGGHDEDGESLSIEVTFLPFQNELNPTHYSAGVFFPARSRKPGAPHHRPNAAYS